MAKIYKFNGKKEEQFDLPTNSIASQQKGAVNKIYLFTILIGSALIATLFNILQNYNGGAYLFLLFLGLNLVGIITLSIMFSLSKFYNN